MSINLTYQRFAPAEFARVTASQSAWKSARAAVLPGLSLEQLQAMAKNPSEDAFQQFAASLQAKADDATRVDLDKWWHVFHYLLTGSDEIPNGQPIGPPLHHVVFGGIPTAVHTGYGPVRALSGEALREVAEAMAGLPVKAFLSRWDVAAMQEKDLYACPEDEEREIVVELFESLKGFLSEAAARGEVVVVYGH